MGKEKIKHAPNLRLDSSILICPRGHCTNGDESLALGMWATHELSPCSSTRTKLNRKEKGVGYSEELTRPNECTI